MASLGAVAISLMNKVAKQAEIIPENSETLLTVPWNPGHGVHFYDRLIVINNSAGIAVFSSLCPHLGCRINKIEGAEFVCPCHGSRFNLLGELVHGPAMRGLRRLPFALDRSNAVLRATLEN
ncbi:MAG: Rieske (2Fe-2S) protein [Terracidiphilus sp.]